MVPLGRLLAPSLMDSDWPGAFEAHPKIGRYQEPEARYAAPKPWPAASRPAAIAPEAVLQKLKDGHDAYYARFGYLFSRHRQVG